MTSDVWDLAEKANGNHVIIALTPEECRALIRNARPTAIDPAEKSAVEEIRRSLRDQKKWNETDRT